MKKVLVVDDDPMILEFLKALFERRNFRVIEAENGEKAIILARREKPDLILLDMQMPITSGWVTAHELKKKGMGTSNIPTIAVTSLKSPEEEAAARKAGCDEFVAKPIDVDTLFHVVDKVLA